MTRLDQARDCRSENVAGGTQGDRLWKTETIPVEVVVLMISPPGLADRV